MQEQNLVSIDYFKVKERFADLINGFVYHGRQAVREEDIIELDPVLPVSVRQGQAAVFQGNVNILDLMRQVRVKCHVVLVALQNQAEIHCTKSLARRLAPGTCFHHFFSKKVAVFDYMLYC